MSSIRAVLALCCLLVAAAGPGLSQPSPPAPDPPEGYLQQTVRVAPLVWVLMQPTFQLQPTGNVTVIEQSDGLVLIDAGGSPGAGRRIVQAVRRLSLKPVKAIVITHWHGDHPQGLSELLKVWPSARTIATRATQAHLRTAKTMNTPAAPDTAANATMQKSIRDFILYAHRMAGDAATPEEKAGWAASERLMRQYALDMDGAVTLSVSEGFETRLDLPDAQAPVQLLYLGRANTDGDAVVWLPRQKVVVTGDLVVAPVPFGFGSYPGEWIEALGKLRGIGFTTLVPGHGQPQTDRAYIDRLAAALADIRAQVKPLADAGHSLQEVQTAVDVTGQMRALVGDDPWLQRWFRQYWAQPIIASAYKEARGAPIVQSLQGE